ncbi:MAG: hypothetical protein J7604_12365 [Sporocytophaga sp.]|uniref:hypothetical protein n=1 Tax=Sporocytophaga sp. TaxID=2231183 RepID=UPI001B131848|nr:hypothetical protein [Sporocytophaga sp.]MBO9700998.1 hypothetical protein [Sporocytophaga sp.]
MFQKYTETLSIKKEGVRSHWECLRDLTNEFKEGVFIFEISIPAKDNPAIRTVQTFKVKIIATHKQIVFYELSERKNKKVDYEWEAYDASIERYKNDDKFNSLRNAFKTLFKVDINENELFIINYVYGEHCGFAGINPQGRQQIDDLVARKDKHELLKWLKSTNTEKQIYAVDGLYQISRLGVKFTDDELKMIKFVKGKKGTINSCSGCFHTQQLISSVTKQFNF